MRRIGAILLVLLAILLVPYRGIVAPDWTVTVVDEAGRPLPEMTVREEFKDYSHMGEGGEVDAVTDAGGQAHFPLRREWKTFGGWLAHGLISLPGFVHNSYGVRTYVFAFGNGLEGSWVEHGVIADWTGSPNVMQSTIVVKPMSRSK